jgi:hypothetical protein
MSKIMFTPNSEPSARTAPGPKPSTKLYSIFALQKDKTFAGEFETATSKHKFTFAPKSAKLVENKLVLTGSLTVGKRVAQNVSATLAATQGGLVSGPAKIAARPYPNPGGLPITEFTGARGFVGTMFFHLSPLKSSALGLAIDLNKVQLNVRLFPVSEVERELQVLFSDLVAAVYGKEFDGNAANLQVAGINELLAKS